jgi:hypothetical protein
MVHFRLRLMPGSHSRPQTLWDPSCSVHASEARAFGQDMKITSEVAVPRPAYASYVRRGIQPDFVDWAGRALWGLSSPNQILFVKKQSMSWIRLRDQPATELCKQQCGVVEYCTNCWTQLTLGCPGACCSRSSVKYRNSLPSL